MKLEALILLWNPIEFVHSHKIYNTSEEIEVIPILLLMHCGMLRHDPDVILIGEMRDLETYQLL